MSKHSAAVARVSDELSAATSLPVLNQVFRRAVQSYGFSTYAVGHLPDPVPDGQDGRLGSQPFLLIDWPRAWLELYARQGFAADDVLLEEASMTTESFTWSELRQRRVGASHAIFQLAAEFGWRDGFVVPLHDPLAQPGERLGIASLAAANLNDFGPERRREMAEIALRAFGRARMLLASGASNGSNQPLRPRERQVLGFIAEGRSDAEIGRLLTVSPATAHYHVEQVKKRFGATTRAQAVAIALSRGMF